MRQYIKEFEDYIPRDGNEKTIELEDLLKSKNDPSEESKSEFCTKTDDVESETKDAGSKHEIEWI